MRVSLPGLSGRRRKPRRHGRSELGSLPGVGGVPSVGGAPNIGGNPSVGGVSSGGDMPSVGGSVLPGAPSAGGQIRSRVGWHSRPRWIARRDGWRPVAIGLLATVTVLVIGLGAAGRLPGQQGAGPRRTGSAEPGPSQGSPLPAQGLAPAVLPPAPTAGPVPSGTGLSRLLLPLLNQAALGPRVGAEVLDLSTGRQLFGRSADTAFATASTTKLLTTAAALSVLGPQYRMRTTVVAGAQAGQVVLVGGGDPTLATAPPPGFVPAPASLPQLAAATAAALADRGVRSIRLEYDNSLFTGRPVAPTWPTTYLTSGVVAPVSALTVDEGRVGLIAEGPAPRVVDPALAAATAFSRQLRLHGITVTGGPTPGTAPSGQPVGGGSSGTATSSPSGAWPAGALLASVSSPTLSDLLGWMLSTSDNDLAEAIAHLVAHARGASADFPAAVQSVQAALTGLGVPTANLRLFDGSGLSTQTQVEPVVLGDVLALAASPAHPALRPLLTGMAVAGFTGSLQPPRFAAPAARPAVGVVRAKTGTLTGVSAMVGTVEDASGRLLGFVFVADRVPPGGTTAARAALDRLAAAVTGCGCR